MKTKNLVLLTVIMIIYFAGLLLLYSNFQITKHDKGDVKFYSCYDYNCAKILISLINTSEDYKCAFYDLNEKNLVQTFNKTSHDGVGEVLLFEKQKQYSFTQPVSSLSLMHHKFCVINDYITLAGSWNPTERGTYKNDNYIVLISSKKIAHQFEKEFERIKKERHKGSKSLKIKLPENEFDLCFSPKNNCESLFLDQISQAKKSVEVLAFSFTSKPIVDELIKAKSRGVKVEVLFEKTRISKYSAIHVLNKNNITTYLDNNPYTMHEKLFIIDNKTAILGSYNPSSSANNKNDEVVIVIKGEKLLSGVEEEFERVINV